MKNRKNNCNNTCIQLWCTIGISFFNPNITWRLPSFGVETKMMNSAGLLLYMTQELWMAINSLYAKLSIVIAKLGMISIRLEHYFLRMRKTCIFFQKWKQTVCHNEQIKWINFLLLMHLWLMLEERAKLCSYMCMSFLRVVLELMKLSIW